MSVSPFLTVDAVAARYQCSTWTVHERARLEQIPHRKFAGGSSRLLFIESELSAHDDGAELETVPLRGGGRIVRPIQFTKASP